MSKTCAFPASQTADIQEATVLPPQLAHKNVRRQSQQAAANPASPAFLSGVVAARRLLSTRRYPRQPQQRLRIGVRLVDQTCRRGLLRVKCRRPLPRQAASNLRVLLPRRRTRRVALQLRRAASSPPRHRKQARLSRSSRALRSRPRLKPARARRLVRGLRLLRRRRPQLPLPILEEVMAPYRLHRPSKLD